ncbi:phosphate ABC transporter substrate-binding protein PstS [Tomitella biformata]|uniref:phosphate ABC transporter substrate-binding protein PstS n=1 Tax=Tomitella biformata TaxID=630403 RepID=UPI0004646AD6|nr:phosphate ABC transporter substrate-binding protein PstS [Tomitella biformata]
MKFSRTPALVGLFAVTALGLAACGSDNNAATGTTTDAASASVDCSGAETLSGAGSSAQKNAMDQFTTAYIAACQSQGTNVNVAYTASGSGDGRTQFVANQIDFAGSDSAMKSDQLAEAGQRCDAGEAWNLPLVFGPVAIAYNLDGVEGLVLDAPTLAKIFGGEIANWNDPAIAALNSGVSLPDQKIDVVYRSDSSGTTDNFQTYLGTAAKAEWTKGAGSDFVGGVGNGSKGSAGVAQAVGTAAGSITYVEQSFADQSGLQVAKIHNGNSVVELNSASAAKAIEGAEFLEPGTNNLALDLTSIYGTSEEGAYPLVLATYEVVCGKGYDAQKATAVKSFLTVAANQGQQGLAELGYVPLPDAMKTTLLDAITAIS